MSNSANKKYNIKQILVLIFFAIIIVLGIFTNNNYNENDIDTNTNVITEISYSLDNIPEYSTSPFVVINNNKPNFEEKDFETDSFEFYSDLDDLGRCGFAFANLSEETMPKEDEGEELHYYVYVYNVQPGITIDYATGESKLAE